MSGGGQQQSTVQNKDPWGQAVPALNQILSGATNAYNSGAGTQLWGGPLQAQLTDETRAGLGSLTQAANAQMGTANQPYNYAQSQIQNNGLTGAYNAPLSTLGGISSGQNGINTGQSFGDIASKAGSPTASSQYLTSLANGSQADNPYLKGMLDTNNALIANRVNSSVAGMGRYGSGGHTQVLTNALTAADNPVLAQAYSDQQNRQLTAAQAIDAANRAAQGTQISALSGQTGVQGQNISNQMQGAQGQAGILNAGQQFAQNYASMIPQLQQAAYAPGNQMLGIGNYLQGYQQQGIDALRQQYQQQQNMPWTQLQNYAGIAGPIAGMGGQTTQNSTLQNNPGFLDYAKLFAGGGSSAAAGGANVGSALLGLLSKFGG